jgi:glycosyltransferase involved in cell wall biosynthesis
MPLVTFIIPTLNERQFDVALDALAQHLGGIADARFEILLVDDSPGEGLAQLRRWVDARAHLAPHITIQVIEGARQGKGHAVRLGALRSQGDIVFSMDADLPVPLENIERFMARLAQGADVVIAERSDERNAGKMTRKVLSRALRLLQQGIVFQSQAFADTQCGFKAFRGDVLRSFARRQITDGGMYDIEYLYMARIHKLKVESVPLQANPETRPTRIRLWKCVAVDPWALVRIKATGLRGRYRQ